MYKLEICANSVASCIEAQRGGAYRVELCSGIPEGGTTPSYGEIMLAREKIAIQLNVIIRPRGGDFLYCAIELETMLKDIEMCGKVGVDGVVFGCLTADGEIDMEKNALLINAAKGMNRTFHRAFDRCKNPIGSLEKIISLGFDTVLTSGGKANALDGVDFLRELVEQARHRIIIMPGSGINEDNIAFIARETGASEFHLSARTPVESAMKFRETNFSMGSPITLDEYVIQKTDEERVRKTLDNLLKST